MTSSFSSSISSDARPRFPEPASPAPAPRLPAEVPTSSTLSAGVNSSRRRSKRSCSARVQTDSVSSSRPSLSKTTASGAARLSARSESGIVSRVPPTAAASSSSTSPSSLRSATASYGVGPLVTIASLPPLLEGEAGQPGGRVDGERGADADHQLGPFRQLRRSRHRALRQQLAEEDDVGFNRTSAGRADGDIPCVEQPLDLLEVIGRRAAGAGGGLDRAVHLDHVLGARSTVQAVDVLGDHAREQTAALELGQRLVGGVRAFVPERVEARPVVGPESLRIAFEDVDVGDLHRVDVRPDPRLRGAEVRDAGRDRDSGPGQRDGAAGLADQLGEPGRESQVAVATSRSISGCACQGRRRCPPWRPRCRRRCRSHSSRPRSPPRCRPCWIRA